MVRKNILVLIFFLLFVTYKTSAQQNSIRISCNFHQADIKQVADELENKGQIKVYYDMEEFTGMLFNLKIENAALPLVLDSLFGKTSLSYAIYNNYVFLTKTKIRTTLSSLYQKDGLNIPENQLPEMLQTEGNAILARVENKLYEVGKKTDKILKGNITVSGFVINGKTREPVPQAQIFDQNNQLLGISNQNGTYKITLPSGKSNISIRSVGMVSANRKIMIYSSGILNIEIQEQSFLLDEVRISADKTRNVKAVELGVNRLDIKSIKQVPVVFGESDILRVVLTLPGVKSVGEANTGFNVRGGSTDQNLVLLNDATVFSPAHFFGFFSAFNPEIVKDIELYKSSIPQKYGGRLSSVLEVTNRAGSADKFKGSAGIGLLTSRLNIEGPIDSGRTSFIFGGRTTYANWLLKLLPQEYENSKASFYDFNLDINHKVDDKNNLLLSAYVSSDKFKLNSDTAYNYNNNNFSLRWKHVISDKLYGTLMGAYSGYNYNVGSSSNPVNAYNLFFGIKQGTAKADFTYDLNDKHHLDFGVNTIFYHLSPGEYTAEGPASLVNDKRIESEKALETSFYIGDRFDLSPVFSVNLGLRYSWYNYLGANTVNTYTPGIPMEENNATGSRNYGAGKIIKTYHRPEIRASFRYNLAENLSVKGGYNTLNQYIHLLSNSTSISPTDIWKLSDPNIKPQRGSQISLGLYHNNRSNTIEFSAEGYYKKLKDYLDYKSGATLVLNDHIETDVVKTQGEAYGAEFMIRKTSGSLNGWISYTYSRTLLKMTDASQGDLINNGAFYPGNADKPHDFNFTGNYKFTHRYSISVNVAYSTGRPITLPIAKYEYGGALRVLYSDRNQYRIPDYFRSDFSLNIEGNHKLKQLTHNTWTIGVYNLTGRQNAYSTYFVSQKGVINGYKLSIFASAIPFINYNIRF